MSEMSEIINGKRSGHWRPQIMTGQDLIHALDGVTELEVGAHYNVQDHLSHHSSALLEIVLIYAETIMRVAPEGKDTMQENIERCIGTIDGIIAKITSDDLWIVGQKTEVERESEGGETKIETSILIVPNSFSRITHEMQTENHLIFVPK